MDYLPKNQLKRYQVWTCSFVTRSMTRWRLWRSNEPESKVSSFTRLCVLWLIGTKSFAKKRKQLKCLLLVFYPFCHLMTISIIFRKSLFMTFYLHHLRKNSTFVPSQSPFLAPFFRKSAKNQNGKNHLRKKSFYQVADYESVTKNNPWKVRHLTIKKGCICEKFSGRLPIILYYRRLRLHHFVAQ